MAYRLVVTETFELSSANAIEWLRKEWSDKSALLFNEKLARAVETIIVYPTSGRLCAKFKNVRSVLVTKHNRLYYRFTRQTISLLELVETKQNPQKNKYE